MMLRENGRKTYNYSAQFAWLVPAVAWLGLIVLTTSVAAQTPAPVDDGFWTRLGRATKFRHDPVTPKDFVVKSRTTAARDDFMPVGITPPERDIRVKSGSEVAGTEAALDALRGKHDRVAGRKPRKLAVKAAPAAKPPAVARNPVNILVPAN